MDADEVAESLRRDRRVELACTTWLTRSAAAAGTTTRATGCGRSTGYALGVSVAPLASTRGLPPSKAARSSRSGGSVRVGVAFAAGDRSVCHQQQQRAEDRDNPGADIEELVELADAERAGDEAAADRAGDTDAHRDEDAAGIVAGKDRLCDRPREETQHDPADDSHSGPPPCRPRNTRSRDSNDTWQPVAAAGDVKRLDAASRSGN